ncbi:MAG: flagellar type III secretion system pore protein FliP [Planctomycetia bacterium]
MNRPRSLRQSAPLVAAAVLVFACLQAPARVGVAAESAPAEPPIAPSPTPTAVESEEGSTPRAAPKPAPAALPPPVALDAAAVGEPQMAKPVSPALVSPGTLAVIAAACAALVVLRLAARRRVAPLPPDVFAVLGEASLAGQHGVRIVRFGPKTLLVSVSSGGCRTLAELTDPEATACIVAACRGTHPPHKPRATAPTTRAAVIVLAAVLAGAGLTAVAADPADAAVSPVPTAAAEATTSPWAEMAARLLGARSLDATLSAALMFGVASLAPAVLLMTTSFVRMSVVLSLLRQGLGTQHLPSNQIVTSLALFLSALVMWPVWTQAWRAGVEPYQAGQITLSEAYQQGSLPVRRWMAGQIEQAGNRDTMLLFLKRHPSAPHDVKTYDDVPVESLLPAFLVSELETAFAIGFRLLLPFLVLDIVVATLVVSTGLVMLPPTLVSLPLKLLVFVMADGWSLVVQSLLDSVRAVGAS